MIQKQGEKMKKKKLITTFGTCLTAALLSLSAACGPVGFGGNSSGTEGPAADSKAETVSGTDTAYTEGMRDGEGSEKTRPETEEATAADLSDSDKKTETAQDTDEEGFVPEEEENTWNEGEGAYATYEGSTFTFDGQAYEIEGNEILGFSQADNFLIIESHVNPHISAYSLFCTDTREVEQVIMGANFTWYGTDISTAIYSSYSEIYNYRGNCIGSVDGSEIAALTFLDPDPSTGSTLPEEIVVSYWKDGDDMMYTDVCEYSYTNGALFAYENYLRKPTKSRWDTFLSFAPEGAVGFAIEGGCTSDIIWDKAVDTNATSPTDYDTVIAVALQKDTSVALLPGTWTFDDASGKENFLFDEGTTEYRLRLNRGEAVIYGCIIPEGIPSVALDVRAGSGSSPLHGYWMVSMLSGYDDTCCTFITAE